MTQDEQQQANAAFRFYEQQVANLAREGANAAMLCEALAIKLKAAQEKIKELEGTTNVVPIKTEPTP